MHVTISGAMPYAPVKSATVRWKRGGELHLSDDNILLLAPDRIFIGRVEYREEKSLQVIEECVFLTEVSSISFEYDPVPGDIWDRLAPQYQPHPPLYYEFEAKLDDPNQDPYPKGKPHLN